MKSYRSHASPLAILSWGMLLSWTLDVPCFEPRASGMRGAGRCLNLAGISRKSLKDNVENRFEPFKQ